VGKRSRLEIPVGQELKDEYGLGYHERLRLEVRGNPKWDGKQGRLELEYDEVSDTFRAFQPVTVPDSRLDSPLASEEAALDVGANNLVACSTTTGNQYLYDGRELFGRFRETTDEIARLQSKLREGRYSSNRIRRLYRQRTKRRDHAQNALVRDLVERLYDEGVATVYVGDLTDVLEAHWSVRVNEKTHNFWAFKKFIHRLACVCEEYGISLETESEAWTSQTTSRVWRPREDGSPRGYADVSMWLRGARRPHGVRDVPSGKQQLRNQADGTARAIRVGRPRLVGETIPSRKSQRSAHEPASCLRGSVAEPSTEESSRFSAGGCQALLRPPTSRSNASVSTRIARRFVPSGTNTKGIGTSNARSPYSPHRRRTARRPAVRDGDVLQFVGVVGRHVRPVDPHLVDRHVEGVGEESFQPIVAPVSHAVNSSRASPPSPPRSPSRSRPTRSASAIRCFQQVAGKRRPRKRSYIDASVESGRSRAAIRRRSSTALSSRALGRARR